MLGGPVVSHVNVGVAMIREEPASQQDATEGLLWYQIAPNVEATGLAHLRVQAMEAGSPSARK